ncbi:IgGFc-binding protein-like [Lingula anatina]|uniref:IgGFc-binding protein-like n=1 Tax=Lingula anatina TaxID=7574 RepID=A0A1S3JA79_LINAN|nr:IgGFc-binding protein-like [Lingula anatina]|eukprot:XP_013407310.1 IgGFc-binding protein-like [Lingula anatina]
MEILTVVFCVLSFGLVANCAVDVPDNSGKEFIIAFMDNAFESAVSLNLFLTTNYPSPIQVRISAHPSYLYRLPHRSRTANVRRGLITKVEIPNSFAMQNSSIEFKGVYLSADEEFILYGSNAESASLDAFVALPVDILGQEYIAGSYKSCADTRPALVGLIGVNNNTQIEITPPNGTDIIVMGRSKSSTTVITLNRLETIQIQSNSDVTGTRINSSKPLAVMSGNECANIPCGVHACDHLVEQMYPVDRWGYTFTVVPSAYRQSGDIIRVVGSTDDTVVDITGVPRLVLHKSEFYEFKVLKDAPVFVNASKPIMVLQFTQSQDTDHLRSDPYMMVVPAIEQFSSSYTIATANLPDKVYKNFINIVIKNSSKEDLRVDGAALNGVTWLTIPGTDFTAAQLSVTAGTHRIEHISPIQTFSVFSYGFARYVSYGYPGGLRLANLDVTKCVPNTGQPADGVDNDCDMKIDEELFNGIDDDDDGVIDEDLSSLPPEVDFPKDTVIVSGNASVTHTVTAEAGTPNATGSERCVAYRDITINFTDSINDNGCGMDIQRTWFVQDGCGNIVQATQNMSVYSSWKAFRGDPSFDCTAVLQKVGCNHSTAGRFKKSTYRDTA